MRDHSGLVLNQWAQLVHDLAKEKGFHDDLDSASARERLSTFLMNLHSEISEAWEAFRLGTLWAPCDKSEKMVALGLPRLTCLEEELADVIIRALHLARYWNIDIDAAVAAKHAYNQTRPHRHGNKLA